MLYKIKVLLPKICFHVVVVLSSGAIRVRSTNDMRSLTTEGSFFIKFPYRSGGKSSVRHFSAIVTLN